MTIKYTITQGNDILKVIEAGKLSLAELQVQTGQVLHSGNYDPDYYEYDSVNDEFTLRANPREKEITELTDRQIIFILLRELRAQGYSFPSLNRVMRTKQHANEQIDQAASRACERFVSRGKFTVFEYQITQTQVKEWRSAGSPTNDVPEMLQSWLDNSSYTTADQAAVNIEQTAAQFNQIVSTTRRLRLEGKAAVNAASASNFKSVAQTYINQLDAIGPT